MVAPSANTHRAITFADLADNQQPLSVFIKAPTKPIEHLAPGAFIVEDLAQAHMILDPGINLVVVRRTAWRTENNEQISKALRQISDSAEIIRTHSTWNSTEREDIRFIPLRVAHHFGRSLADVMAQPGFVTMVNDIAEQISLLKSVSDADKIFFNSRFIRDAPQITEPSKHADDQFLTISCAYLGGGTVCELEPNNHIQLAPGEIGIWKGKIGKKRDQFIEDAENEGQPLVHWTPFGPQDYPRFVSLIDAYDDKLPEKLVALKSFAPWDTTPQ